MYEQNPLILWETTKDDKDEDKRHYDTMGSKYSNWIIPTTSSTTARFWLLHTESRVIGTEDDAE